MKSLVTVEIPISILTRITDAVVQLATDYSDLHREELQRIRAPAPAPEKARLFYQSDKELYEAEMNEKSELVDIL